MGEIYTIEFLNNKSHTADCRHENEKLHSMWRSGLHVCQGMPTLWASNGGFSFGSSWPRLPLGSISAGLYSSREAVCEHIALVDLPIGQRLLHFADARVGDL